MHKTPKFAQLLLILMATLVASPVMAHGGFMDDHEGCAHDEIMNDLTVLEPIVAQQIEEAESTIAMQTNLMHFGLVPELMDEEVYTVPVVFHVILPADGTDLSDAELQNSLDWLNEQFANLPGSNLPPGLGFQRDDGTDTKLQFAMALRDPDGNAFDGINRVTVNFESIPTSAPNAATNTAAWPRDEYLNVWITEEIDGAAGFAYLPSGSTPDYRAGVFVEARYFNNQVVSQSGTLLEYTYKNRVLAHEVGHYYGLRHTFHNYETIPGCVRNPGEPQWKCYTQDNFNCVVNGDRVCDTPPDGWGSSANGTNCPGSTPMNTASTDADDTSSNNPFTEDVNDIHANIMDYAGSQCVMMFSEGQKDRMRLVFNAQHMALLDSPALEAPTTGTCTEQAPILTINPNQVHVQAFDQSGTITAQIKNNNIGGCGEKTFALSEHEGVEGIETYMVSNEVTLNTQETTTIEINYEIDLSEQDTYNVMFELQGQGGEALRGVVFDATEASSPPTSVANNPFAFKELGGDASGSAQASLAGAQGSGGCGSNNSSMIFLLGLVMMGLFLRPVRADNI